MIFIMVAQAKTVGFESFLPSPFLSSKASISCWQAGSSCLEELQGQGGAQTQGWL